MCISNNSRVLLIAQICIEIQWNLFGTAALALAIKFGDMALTMQYDRLGMDRASVIRNREVSLIWRSSKYMFLWLFGTIDGRTEVSLIWRSVIDGLS